MTDSRNDPVKEYTDKSDAEREAFLKEKSPYYCSQLVNALQARLTELQSISENESWKIAKNLSEDERKGFEVGLPRAIDALKTAVEQINTDFGKKTAEKENKNAAENQPAAEEPKGRRKSSLLSFFKRGDSEGSAGKRKRSIGRKSSLEGEPKKQETPQSRK
jgi:hypothetical protein